MEVDVNMAAANATPPNATELPLDMKFNDGHVVAVACYPFLMIVSAVGNITVLVILLRRRKRNRSRINNMLLHLSIADLLVTFLMMPLEIAWNWTVDWRGGDALCRIMSFFRIFGLYLSSYVLVCISLDRYFAVLRPMQISDRRGRWMLTGAWVAAVICSLPQMVVFQALPHFEHKWYMQCITMGTLTTPMAEVTYAAFGMVALYLLPLAVIIFSYASILVEIFHRSRDPIDVRRSSLGFLGRAKIRTLKMTIIIVLVFFVCSTPYYVMMVWYWVDRKNAINSDQRLQKGLMLFASANSCMNPIVYGAFNIRTRRSNSQRQRPKNSRVRALGLLRLVSWRRDRDEDCAAAASMASMAGRGEPGLHGQASASAENASQAGAAHALCHRGSSGSHGSQGSEVSCATEWSELNSIVCLKQQGVDPAVGAVGRHGPQADAEKRSAQQQAGQPRQQRQPGGSLQGLQEPQESAGGLPGLLRSRLPENHRFRLAQRSCSAPGLPLGHVGHAGLAGPGRVLDVRGQGGGAGGGGTGGARRDGGGGGAGGGAGAAGAGGAEEVTSCV